MFDRLESTLSKLMNKIATPINAEILPIISSSVTFSLNRNIENGIISIMFICAIVVDIPKDVYFIAAKLEVIPRNGPKILPNIMNNNAVL